MTDHERDDEVGRWLGMDSPPEPSEDFWPEVDASLSRSGNVLPSTATPGAAAPLHPQRARRSLVAAAIALLVGGGLVAAFALGVEREEPVRVAADPDDPSGTDAPSDVPEEVEVSSPTPPVPTPVAIESTGDGSPQCPEQFELSEDGAECFLFATPTLVVQAPIQQDEEVEAQVETVDGTSTAVCPIGFAGPTSAGTCTRRILTAVPDLAICDEGVVARTKPPTYFSSGLVISAGDACLLEREPVVPLPAVAPVGDDSRCPESHPYRAVDADQTGGVDDRQRAACFLPGGAPFGLFATALPTAGEPFVGGPGFESPWTSLEDGRSVPVFDEPGGEPRSLTYIFLDGTEQPFSLANPTFFDQPLVLRVVELHESGDWLRVHAPTRPKQQSVWVEAASFSLGRTSRRIEIDVGQNMLWLLEDPGTEDELEDDLVLIESPIISGRADRPTPLDQAYITQAMDPPEGAAVFGARILWLSSFSESINMFSGGLPQQRIHGTDKPELIPERISSGSIRVSDEVILAIDELVGPGTPVLVYDSRSSETDRDTIAAIQPDTPALTRHFGPEAWVLGPG